MLAALRHIDCWIFDLDNSLYPASANLFALIDVRMGEYISKLLGCDAVEARRVQKQHFHTHGTTLAGLMQEHGVDPQLFSSFARDLPKESALLPPDCICRSMKIQKPSRRSSDGRS